MRCPFCGATKDRVVDSRESRDHVTIRRRRECLSCERRFTSYEQIEDIPYLVVKSDGSRQEFDRKKLLQGLLKACEKRPVPLKKLEDVVDEIQKSLRELDQVAYVRFASVYRKFEDIGAFMEELKTLLHRQS